MTADPILGTLPVIQVHIVAAVAALLLTPVQFLRRRRDRWHRRAGRVWVAAMAALAVTGLFIPSFGLAVVGHFGPIHLLSLYVLWGLWLAIRAARAGRIDDHRAHMRGMSLGALGIAGLFTLVPGRTMSAVFFPGHPQLAWVALGLGLAVLGALAWRGSRRRAAA
ncbi:DUF2306 domain-containing protein [Histidinibacterium lentulum]|uniref:DUF2306 domain-containing protein n=1 Tax=Histidinibacterium lentulum TaxID=2480588 RepID=A0A3N2QS61_9RHOB|nr:DUF2306 domain-containing protein [Histidinibacterium lentulum]ROT98000.1 DUF2306 domain-containing protein [Histidinibacterium lentulum]